MFWPFILIAEFWKAERERRARIVTESQTDGGEKRGARRR